MPVRIADVVVAVAPGVVVVVAEYGADDETDARIVDEVGQVVAAVDKRYEAGVFLVVVCASALRPHALELCADVIDLGREEAAKYQEPEGVEESQLLFCQSQGSSRPIRRRRVEGAARALSDLWDSGRAQ